MGKNKNVLNRRRIREAMSKITSPFTAKDISTLSGVPAQRVAALLRGFDDIEKIPVNRTARLRSVYKIVPVLS